MPEIINGDGTQPIATRTTTRLPPALTSQSAFVRVDSTTNATPVAVATDTAHGYYTGDTVELEGASALSGTHVITVTGANGFTLNDTTAPGWVAGSTTAYVTDYEVQPAFQLPNPGEPASMTTLAPVLKGLMNAIPWLYRLTGKRRTHQVYYGTPPGAVAMPIADYGAPGWPDGGAVVATTSAGTYYAVPETLTPVASMVSDIAGAGASPVFEATDEIDVSFHGAAAFTTPTANHRAFLMLTFSDGVNTVNAAQLNTSAESAIALGGITGMTGDGTVGGIRPVTPFVLRQVISVEALIAIGLTNLPGALSVGIAVMPTSTDATASLAMVGPANWVIVQRRPN